VVEDRPDAMMMYERHFIGAGYQVAGGSLLARRAMP
jgi:hypothetical protein